MSTPHQNLAQVDDDRPGDRKNDTDEKKLHPDIFEFAEAGPGRAFFFFFLFFFFRSGWPDLSAGTRPPKAPLLSKRTSTVPTKGRLAL